MNAFLQSPVFRSSLVAISTAFALPAFCHAQAANSYKFVDLGRDVVVTGINNKGEVVGIGVPNLGDAGWCMPMVKELKNVDFSCPGYRSRIWRQNTGWSSLNIPGYKDSAAYAIDDNSNVVGVVPNKDGTLHHRAYWQAPSGQTKLFPGTVWSVATQVRGNVVTGSFCNRKAEWSFGTCGPTFGYLWDAASGTYEVKEGPHPYWGEKTWFGSAIALASDPSGRVVGGRAFTYPLQSGGAWWDAGQTKCSDGEFGSCAASRFPENQSDLQSCCNLTAVNGKAQAVGADAGVFNNIPAIAAMWDLTASRTTPPLRIGSLGDGLQSNAYDINDSSVAVGTSYFNPDYYWPHAFVWDQANGIRDLNALTDKPSYVEMYYAVAINQSGWIVGMAIEYAHGKAPEAFHSFLLIPN